MFAVGLSPWATTAENKLWDRLKGKQPGVKFRRQHVIEPFIPDFVTLSIKLIVEVDEKIHLKQKKKDMERTFFLEQMGYKVIRFKNEEIENDIRGGVRVRMNPPFGDLGGHK